jgi:hypothetical protein
LIVLAIGLGAFCASYLPYINHFTRSCFNSRLFTNLFYFCNTKLVFLWSDCFAVVTITRNISRFSNFVTVRAKYGWQFTNDADNRFIAGPLDPFGVEAIPITPSIDGIRTK